MTTPIRPRRAPPLQQQALDATDRDKQAITWLDPSASRDLIISAFLFNLGFLRLAILGEYESAADVLQQAHALRKTVLGETHTLAVQAMVSRGWALTLTGETVLAVDELTR